MITHKSPGIWRYAGRLPEIADKFKLTLGEGNTSQVIVDGLVLKKEYENPTGSVKDRSIAYQVSKMAMHGIKAGVISSSGNAGISAATYCKLAGIDLHVFVSPNIRQEKLEILRRLSCKIEITAKPVSASFQFAQNKQVHNMRQSTDPDGSTGYQTIAFELAETALPIDAVFIPVSSGTILTGVFDGWKKTGNKIPAFHLVQTSTIHPVSHLYDKDFIPEKKSLADAIVARVTPRQLQLEEIIRYTKGAGWTIDNKEMEQSRKWLIDNGIETSYEGAAVIAASQKAMRNGYHFHHPLCLLTGKDYVRL